jgi:probable HAF family extracellular repeat protein
MSYSRAIGICVAAGVMFCAGVVDGAWFMPLPNLPGARQPNDAMAVSADGSTIVGTANDGITDNGLSNRAVRWDATGAIQVIDATDNSYAWGVSGDGSVIVGYRNVFRPGYQDGFRWTAATGPVLVGDLPGGNVGSVAYDVSEDGRVVVGKSSIENSVEAFRYTTAEGMVGIGDLPGGAYGSVAYEASRDGSVIVGYSHSSNGTEAFRWTKATGMVGLGDLPTGGFYSEANDVSADGSVVVGRGAGRNPFDYTAFRWTGETGMIEIPPTAGGRPTATAEAVSDDGNVIVGALSGGVGPFAWDPYHRVGAGNCAWHFRRWPNYCRPGCASWYQTTTGVGTSPRFRNIHSRAEHDCVGCGGDSDGGWLAVAASTGGGVHPSLALVHRGEGTGRCL